MVMKRISVFVSERQYEAFGALAEKMGQPASELIRQALNEFLDRHVGSPARAARKRASTRKRA